MSTTDLARAAAYLPMMREATHILRHIVDHIQGVTPMPDGRVTFQFEGDEAILDRLCEWGATIEDDEDDGCAEYDERDEPKLAADGVSRVSASPAQEIARLYEPPASMLALAERIAA